MWPQRGDRVVNEVSQDESLIEYPCDFLIKAVGEGEGVRHLVLTLIQQHAPDLTEQQLTERPSKHGKYLAISATVWVENRRQLDAIYRSLSQHPRIRFVL